MTPQRFVELSEAYGADLHRWPVSEQVGAQVLLAQGSARVVAAHAQARWLDAQLDRHEVMAPSPTFVQGIVASATSAPSWWARSFTWLFGASFVGVGVAGVLAGMLVASVALPLAGEHEFLPNLFDTGNEAALELDRTEDSQQ